MASSCGETKFSVMVSLFRWIQKSKSSTQKRSKFRKFLDAFCKPEDYFAAVRLILPGLDRERGSYGLKEHVLATCLIDALGMSKESPDAVRLLNWRKGGAMTGINAGNFALVATEVLQSRQRTTSGELTIKGLNYLLDRLASCENRPEKTNVLSDLIKKTNSQEMTWIILIILKDLKLGISEKSIFQEFHPDAEDLFNVTCDLKLVCEKLKNRSERHKRQDIEVGKPVRPQLALRVGNASAAWKKLNGKQVVVECKFDGDRIQIHKNKAEVHFFSRNFLDHPEYGHAMQDLIVQNILVEKCILDGEMLVWDTSLNRFAEFGSNQEIAKAPKNGFDSERQLCYVAFDILYVGDTSVIHQSLKERHELLRKVMQPLKGRLEILVPNNGLNAHCPVGEPCWSLIAHNVEDVDSFFKETVDNGDEGIVLKDLGSKWDPGDRSVKWLKLKPDYIQSSSDLDVLIIGGYYGSGRHGGEIAQFLVGLAERSVPNTYPRRFISFCRVGTGLSDEELDAVVTKLRPYFRKYEYPKKSPPSYYQVTNNSKERPDVWIESPEKSIIVSITSDIRTINSEVFAAPYSLRFPRIDRVRYDKPWHDCLDVQSFIELVHSSNGATQKAARYGFEQNDKPQLIKPSKKMKRNTSIIPSHFVQTDVSFVKEETLIFSNMMFYFVNLPPTHSLDSLHKMVAEHGGSFSMNLNNSVTHCVGAESKGIRFQAAKLHKDIIHYLWLLDCCSQRNLLPLQPKYFLYLSVPSKKQLQEEIDDFSDSYFKNVEIVDIKQLLGSIDRTEDSKTTDYYKTKYCPEEKRSRFQGCCIYFHLSLQSLNSDWKVLFELASRRMKLEVSMGGGTICESLFHTTTHLVLMTLPGFLIDFSTIVNSFSGAERRLLYSKNLHVVGSQWLEHCFEKDQKLPEESYTLKPHGLQGSTNEFEPDLDMCQSSCLSQQNRPSSPCKNLRRRERKAISEHRNETLFKNTRGKRGRAIGVSKSKRKSYVQRPKARVLVGKKPSKIFENESDTNSSLDEKTLREEQEVGGIVNHKLHKTIRRQSLESSDFIKDCKQLERGNMVEREVLEDSKQKQFSNEGSSVCGARGLEDQDNTIDPVEAMLLNMIPSLGTQKIESLNPILEEEKPFREPNPDPVKKRKVSYKDVAGELLKDW